VRNSSHSYLQHSPNYIVPIVAVALDDDEDGNTEHFPIYFDHVIAGTPVSPVEPPPDDGSSSHPSVDFMMESQLRSLYKAAHEYTPKSKIRIKLLSQPTSASLVSLFLVPFLTREEVQTTPAMRHCFRNMYTNLEKLEALSIEQYGRKLGIRSVLYETFRAVEAMGLRQIEKNSGIAQCTAVAQVAIQCRETFSVRDVELNEVIQGDPEERVNNVVRFEMVVSMGVDAGVSSIESWQITDWDDLLDGNLFYTTY